MGSSSSLRQSAIASLLGITKACPSVPYQLRIRGYWHPPYFYRTFAAPLRTLPGDLADFRVVEGILYCSQVRAAKRIIPTALGSSKKTILSCPIANREKRRLMEAFTDCRPQLGIEFS